MLLAAVIVSLFLAAQGEFYSSLGHMEDLVYEEMKLISTMKDYIQLEQEKLDKMRDLVDNLKANSEEAGSNIEKYLGHPVNQYLLVKRLKSEWDEMEDLVMQNTSVEFLQRLSEKRAQLPDEEDIEGTAKAIMRLQDTYHLDTHDLAEGYIKGSRAAGPLSADDCYKIGRTAYLEQDFYHCALWMREANNKIEHGDDTHDRFDVLDHLSYCYGQQGNYAAAHELIEKMLMIDPTHDRTLGNKAYYDQLLGAKKKGDDGEMAATGEAKLHRQTDQLPERALYEQLCRDGGNEIPKRIEKRLKCYMWDNNRNPRLVLQPFKMEELWPSPHLVRFYDVLSDSEISQLKELAKPRLNRATVQNPITGRLEHAHYRVSKSAWLKDAENATVAKISLRMSDITGLSMATAEELQIANYGVGGQYEPHYDFARKRETRSFDEEIGNRIATFLFYLTDVEHGGSTIFLEPRIAVRPVKGSAVFWYNLYPSGSGDLRTRHAACPVLTGVKWVANKWIHERDQEFNRPCLKNKESASRIF